MNGLLAKFWPIIALAFPVLEIIGIVQVWNELGIWTLLWLALAVLAGSALIALERIAFLPGLAAALLGGGNPLATLKASGLRILAGLMLIFPGALSDGIAMLLLLFAGFRRPLPANRPHSPNQAANDDVIEGEFRRMD